MNTASASLGDRPPPRFARHAARRRALLGLFVVGFVGFSHAEIVHNAGHDYRHSMAFPCH